MVAYTQAITTLLQSKLRSNDHNISEDAACILSSLSHHKESFLYELKRTLVEHVFSSSSSPSSSYSISCYLSLLSLQAELLEDIFWELLPSLFEAIDEIHDVDFGIMKDVCTHPFGYKKKAR